MWRCWSVCRHRAYRSAWLHGGYVPLLRLAADLFHMPLEPRNIQLHLPCLELSRKSAAYAAGPHAARAPHSQYIRSLHCAVLASWASLLTPHHHDSHCMFLWRQNWKCSVKERSMKLIYAFQWHLTPSQYFQQHRQS